jgi:23S rRNA pseudouridine1911/1915/1917 synthase
VSGEQGAGLVRLHVDATDAGQRLDRLLAASGAVVSRARAQALLRAGDVRVGGVPRKASYVVRVGDVVEAPVGSAAPARSHPGFPLPEPLSIEILYEDGDLLVVNKAPGIVVHPAPGHLRGTLVNALLHHLEGAPAAGDPARPGIIHRLDKDTSGVLVVAKTAAAHVALSSQFRDRTVRKEYVAVVRGRMPAREGNIDQPIGRHPHERKRMSVRTRRGRASATRYAVSEDDAVASVVRLFPTTGRTHQLRVHLAAIGHPIVGDRTYGRQRTSQRRASDPLLNTLARFPRQALHAEVLEFSHPRTGDRVCVRAPLPADLRALVVALRGPRAKRRDDVRKTAP